MMNEVPRARIAPTEGISPLRTRHSAAWWSGSRVNSGSEASGSRGSSRSQSARRSFRSSSLSHWYSKSSAAAVGESPAIASGMPGWSWTARSEARSISSSARAPDSRSGAIASQARGTSSKNSRPVYL